MGFAKFYEDIQERYWEDAYHWPGGPPVAAPNLFDRARRAIHGFWIYYTSHQHDITSQPSRWEQHFEAVQALYDLLAPVDATKEADPDAWDVLCDIERRARELFGRVTVYGPLSRGVTDAVVRVSREIRDRCAGGQGTGGWGD